MHIDVILEKVDEITAKVGEESTNSHAEQADLLRRATLSSLVIFAKHIDEISERVERLSERVDETSPEVSKRSNDVQAELENLRRQMKHLTKAVKKARK
jgi:methyl-accepting chemotaxis protein